ncbi:MAG: hypothetical protein EOR57_05285 [Mesorhizobium sp.]|uniref:toxin-antitoxin system HicB family antitoxin n=1 Tax=Mesorhizobium sp. TaxID=1871066 RepID=UPI000FE6F807|nr:toxin-antitoxin system HicB family antitoxin [Mesorhizobium sp.]RWL21862.1 MAG: hypothetical protein EOR57_05285 [Mesorhizobium sp.]
MSLNQWIASAVAQKVSHGDSGDFLRRRAGDASGDDFAKVLDRVGVKPPQPGDELPFDKH